jgi:hypothetical protein
VGSLSFLNTWDFPIYAFVLVAALGLGYWRANKPRLLDVVIDLIVLAALGVAFYLPFYRGFTSQAGGIAPNLYNGTRLARLCDVRPVSDDRPVFGLADLSFGARQQARGLRSSSKLSLRCGRGCGAELTAGVLGLA